MTVVTEEDRITRGRQAAHELRLTEEAFAAVRQLLVDGMINTPAENEKAVMKCHQSIQVLDMVRKALMLVVGDGDMARASLELGLTRNN